MLALVAALPGAQAQESARSHIIVLDPAPPAAESEAAQTPAGPAAGIAPEIDVAPPARDAGAARPSQIIILDPPAPATVTITPADVAASPEVEPPAAPAAAIALPPVPDITVDLRSQVAAVPREAMEQALAAFAAEAQGRETRRLRDSIAAFYGARDFAPLFVTHEGWSAQGRAVQARIGRAGDDGLDLSAYALPALPPAVDGLARARADLALAEAVVAYGRQASGGRVAPQRISSFIKHKPETAEPEAILAAVISAADAGEALRTFNPPGPGYAALRDKLKELREENQVAGRQRLAPIPGGPVLRIGMKDARVPLIRARFGVDPAADAAGAELLYDTRVASAVADFQRAHGIEASGRLTPRTIAALSGGAPEKLEADILANMEMWRWMPRAMGETRIVVNIPEYRLRVWHGEKVAHETRGIVGKPATQTPVFSDVMQFAVVNPSWYVPPSILRKEKLPKMANDPDYWTRRGYVVTRKGNSISIRQPPGDDNALGQIKFMFPNEHAIYLHDTPSRGLFSRDARAFSHGCVRVDKPFAFGEAIMPGWNEARLKKLLGRSERRVNMPEPVPVHLAYFTARVDEAGKLRLFADVYGHARKVKAALALAH